MHVFRWHTTCQHIRKHLLSKNRRFLYQIKANLPNKAWINEITMFLLSIGASNSSDFGQIEGLNQKSGVIAVKTIFSRITEKFCFWVKHARKVGNYAQPRNGFWETESVCSVLLEFPFKQRDQKVFKTFFSKIRRDSCKNILCLDVVPEFQSHPMSQLGCGSAQLRNA